MLAVTPISCLRANVFEDVVEVSGDESDGDGVVDVRRLLSCFCSQPDVACGMSHRVI